MSRLPRGKRLRAAVFIVTIVVVVATATVGTADFETTEPTETPEYAVNELVPDRAPAGGEVSIQPRNDSGVVVFDMSHRSRMRQHEIKPLLTAITAAGWTVDLLEGDDDFDKSLRRADALIVVDPSTGYNDGEVDRIETFVDRGGRLLLVGEPTTLEISGFALRQRVNRLTPLSTEFGFEFGAAYLYNLDDNDGNFVNVFAEPTTDTRLTDGVSRAAFYSAARLSVEEGRVLLAATDGTRSSRTDSPGRYPVAAVNGNVLAIADGSFLQRGNYNVVDNEKFIRNVVRFLVSGEKRRTLEAYPTFAPSELTIRFTRPALVDAAQSLAVDLRGAGTESTIRMQQSAVSPANTDVLVTTYGYLQRHGQLGTGVRVSEDRVSLKGFNAPREGIIVVRRPATKYELVIVADTPARVEQVVDMLEDGRFRDYLISRRTAVVRTAGATTGAA